jgi:hypothetical protein
LWHLKPFFSGPQAGLPDGIFSKQKSQFGKIFYSLTLDDVGIFYRHSVYFTGNWYSLCPFGIFCGHLVFFPVLVCCTKKNLAALALKKMSS